MYSVAEELFQPFGTDLNDLDLDSISHGITSDVLEVSRTQQPAFIHLQSPAPSPPSWLDLFSAASAPAPPIPAAPRRFSAFRAWLRLALIAVPVWQLFSLTLWAGVVLGVSWAISTKFDAIECNARWFCQFGGLNSDVKMYVGTALFLLLGAQINSAHARFVRARTIMHEVMGGVVVLANRLAQGFRPGEEKGGIERVAGHLAAMPRALAAEVRHGGRDGLEGRLGDLIGERDALEICSKTNSFGYCADVVRSYLFRSEWDAAGLSNEEMFIISALLDRVCVLGDEAGQLARVKPPFGYRTHIRVLLVVWLGMLPVGVVDQTGWLIVVWTVVIGYGVLGVLRWSDELVDPFGCDETSLPVNGLAEEAVDEVKGLLRLFPDGAQTIVEEGRERAAFQGREREVSVQFG